MSQQRVSAEQLDGLAALGFFVKESFVLDGDVFYVVGFREQALKAMGVGEKK